MFLGQYKHALDSKGRVILPVKLRKLDELVKSFVLTIGMENCISVYPSEIWDQQAEEYKSIPWNDPNGRTFKRGMFSNATPVEPDRQGRIGIPSHLREYAGIKKEVVIAGMNDHLEIWDREKWAEFSKKAEQSLSENASKLTGYNKL